MDNHRLTPAICGVLAVLIVCAVSYFAGRLKGRQIEREMAYAEGYEAGYNAPHPADTTTRTDTIYIDRPVPVSVKPSGVEMLPVGTLAQMQARIDSLLEVKPDTAFVEIPVPMETKTYRDSTYEAQVSGWHPSLDWIEVVKTTEYITNTLVKEKKFGIGVSAGPGILYDGKIHAGIGVTLGVYYAF